MVTTATDAAARIREVWMVRARGGDTLQISVGDIELDHSVELGIDPGLRKDDVETHLQALLAEHPNSLGAGLSLVRREHMTTIIFCLCEDYFII